MSKIIPNPNENPKSGIPNPNENPKNPNEGLVKESQESQIPTGGFLGMSARTPLRAYKFLELTFSIFAGGRNII